MAAPGKAAGTIRRYRRVLRDEKEVGPVLYWLIHVVMGPLVRAFHNPWVEGLENVPEHGPAILASNHLSFSDSIFLPLALPRRIWFPAKMEYFTKPGLRGKLSKAFFAGTGQIPIDRSGGNASENALRAGMSVLERGGLFGIYPEGTRSPDGRLYKGKTGMARLALESRVPVIPVAMIDTDKFQPTGKTIPTGAKVGIRIGKPLDFSRYHGMSNDRRVLRAITDEIMYELARLSGREYVDEYAAARKAALAVKAEEILAKGSAKAEEFVAAGREKVDTVTARAEEFVATGREKVDHAGARAGEFLAATKERTKERTQQRIEARHGGGRDRAISVGEDPRDISPLRSREPLQPDDQPGASESDGAGHAAETDDPFTRHVPAAADQLLHPPDDDGDAPASSAAS